MQLDNSNVAQLLSCPKYQQYISAELVLTCKFKCLILVAQFTRFLMTMLLGDSLNNLMLIVAMKNVAGMELWIPY